ncbi:MAG: PDZ domain-containing protein, partial [Acidimicrobiales bacterium]|nr:PDZ domain-containing protein [Acidimicrobiales bacterium]
MTADDDEGQPEGPAPTGVPTPVPEFTGPVSAGADPAPPDPTTRWPPPPPPSPAMGAPGAPPPGVMTPPSVRPPAERRRRRWPWIVLAVLVVTVAVASRVNLDDYAIQPGTAQSVQQFITVPPARSHPVTHPVLLTDVQIARVTALSYLFYKVQGDTDLQPVSAVVGPFPPSQLVAQGNLEMSQAESAAKAAALTHLGYPVSASAAGAVVAGTFAGTPAESTLSVGDVITAIDGVPVTTATGLTATLAHYHSGQTVTLSVEPGGSGPARPVTVTLRATRVEVAPGETVVVNLGIQPEDQVDYHYPFPVTINVADIGGPSAGLAMTLGVMDALTDGSITGGHVVAATGTIAADGTVGAVGG